jgi:hypothetical protein
MMKLSAGKEEPYVLGLDEGQLQPLSYAQELRAVGQALEDKKLLSLDLEFEGGDYLAHGKTGPRSSGGPSIFNVLCEAVGSFLRGRSAGSLDARALETRFTAEQILTIDLEGRARRRDANQTPDAYSLSQLLRGAGAYVDKKRDASLIAVSVNDRWITLRYRTPDRRIEEAKQDIEFFYNYWVKMYLHRRNRDQMSSQAPKVTLRWDEPANR